MDEIKIRLFRKKKSPYWIMRYNDPESGKPIDKSTGTRSEKAAEREAWEVACRFVEWTR